MKAMVPRLIAFALVLIAIGWIIHFFCGDSLAGYISAKFEALLSNKSQGKISNPTRFIHARTTEALTLGTYFLCLIIAIGLLDHILSKLSLYQIGRGVALGFICFAAINVFLLMCGKTVLFWVCFLNGKYFDNYAQYQIKKRILLEQSSPSQALLIGNSQTQSSFDESIMNRELGSRLWTTELHQRGSCGFDLLIQTRDLRNVRHKLVICYITPIYFYGHSNGEVASQFLHFRDLIDLFQLNGWRYFPPGAVRSGVLSKVVPAFKYRASLSQRALGGTLLNLEQVRMDASRVSDLEAQARARAPTLSSNRRVSFERAGFAQAVDELIQAGHTLIFVVGQLHPALEREMDPNISRDTAEFLTETQKKYPNRIHLWGQEDFFRPTAEDFRDLVHFNSRGQEKMTLRLIQILQLNGFVPKA